MADTSHTLGTADGGPEDLPRTLRRAREEREREAQAASRGPSLAAVGPESRPSFLADPESVAVAAIRVPFVDLMLFFIKAVFAAIPALIVLGILLWVAGHTLEMFFPQIVKMRILIQFPN